ncbi:MAG TPA: cytochrome c oxidase subunit 3 [Microvirga sp.]|nr:cytochrome c oxidase subunit 3 [Microvirga sp.]
MPSYGHGHRSPMWWGTLGFAAAEGMGFVCAAGAYFYLVFINAGWPLSAPPPDLLWSSLLTAAMLVSLWPNQLAKTNGEREDLRRVRRDLVVMSLIGLVLLGLRVLEFGTLHVRWDQNAYGSIVWLLLGFHTAHLLTDVVDTIVLAVLMFTRHGHGKRFSDVGDNAFYWYFVVASWLPIYAILYWLPRWW